MSKKSIIEREKKRSLLCKKYSNLRKSLMEKIDSSSSFEERLGYYFELQKLPRNSSQIRLVWFLFFVISEFLKVIK